MLEVMRSDDQAVRTVKLFKPRTTRARARPAALKPARAAVSSGAGLSRWRPRRRALAIRPTAASRPAAR